MLVNSKKTYRRVRKIKLGKRAYNIHDLRQDIDVALDIEEMVLLSEVLDNK